MVAQLRSFEDISELGSKRLLLVRLDRLWLLWLLSTLAITNLPAARCHHSNHLYLWPIFVPVLYLNLYLCFSECLPLLLNYRVSQKKWFLPNWAFAVWSPLLLQADWYFWLFLTKTKPDQGHLSHVYVKIWPHSTHFWLCFLGPGQCLSEDHFLPKNHNQKWVLGGHIFPLTWLRCAWCAWS